MNSKSILYLVAVLAWGATGCQMKEKTTVQRKDLVDAVFASGNIVTKDRYLVTSLSEGYLQHSFAEEGDSVKNGELLFQLQDKTPKAQLESAEIAYQKAQDNLRSGSPVLQKLYQQEMQLKNQWQNDSVNFVRYSNLIQANAVSKAEFDRSKLACENSESEYKAIQNTIEDTKRTLRLDLANAKANLVAQQENSEHFLMTSQVNGLLLQRFKEDGELVKRGETVAEIGAGQYIARLQVAEEDINRVEVGQSVYIELNTNRNHAYSARISKVYPAFDTNEQSFIAEAVFTEKVPSLKSGTQLQSNIVVAEKKGALVIPADYLEPGEQVFSEKHNSSIKVMTGIETSEWVEIIGGLNEGDVIEKQKS
ncbi:efflux RND transporter periplasmic adaptor subunit [Mangrovibacterium diazotrophicum]|uniref:CusB/HlyD membrane fusion family barrel-sandwich protein n=1 Tax=Mangrovibacterium diazotrophicum TaxID=1261403 RepID=A0A419W470_9BACT|nr:HlyD family efflux transporter periplasmic adaptor subunit [Mangrovibacterium diazotrophicum]RKD90248.1 CusB/HlyD membrane fusion family barrel-sandwich protein [Mangrovibacterium diazotrophicum]